MLVELAWRPLGNQGQPTAHPEMNDQTATLLEIDEEVFGPPTEPLNTSALAATGELTALDRLPEVRVQNLHSRDALASQARGQAPFENFDFWQLGHRAIVSLPRSGSRGTQKPPQADLALEPRALGPQATASSEMSSARAVSAAPLSPLSRSSVSSTFQGKHAMKLGSA